MSSGSALQRPKPNPPPRSRRPRMLVDLLRRRACRHDRLTSNGHGRIGQAHRGRFPGVARYIVFSNGAFAARQEAVLAAREILAEAIRSGRPKIPDAFVIADEAGRALDTILLAAV